MDPGITAPNFQHLAVFVVCYPFCCVVPGRMLSETPSVIVHKFGVFLSTAVGLCSLRWWNYVVNYDIKA